MCVRVCPCVCSCLKAQECTRRSRADACGVRACRGSYTAPRKDRMSDWGTEAPMLMWIGMGFIVALGVAALGFGYYLIWR